MEECTASGIIERLKLAMAARRYSLRMLSNQTGVPYRTLQNYFLGKHMIPGDTIGKICNVMGVSADWVFFGRLYHNIEMLREALHRTGIVPRGDWKRADLPKTESDGSLTVEATNMTCAVMLNGMLDLLNDVELTPPARAREAVDVQLIRTPPKGHHDQVPE